ncbi:MAG: M20 family metallopeptidase, partial [Bacillota bacterium]
MKYSVNDIRRRAEKLLPEVVELRRQFHMNPELGMEEFETAGTVAAYLEDLGIEVRTGVGGTGVVGLLRGSAPGRTAALRADMDALPIEEDSGAEYASRVPGKMHACGHDAHTANLLGTARLLAEITSGGENLSGNVKFLFQPAEEGPGGAEPMIADGALGDPDVDAVFGLHVHTDLPTGKIALQEGVSSASADSADITVVGRGGHGAHPEHAVDSVVVAAHVITALQTLVSRETGPTDSAVITVGRINGGFRSNVIAPRVEMAATVRALTPEIRRALPGRIERIVEGVTRAMRADYELEYSFGYPPLENDPEITALVAGVGVRVLGDGGVIHLPV